jgi:hypothetical protein
LRLALFAKAPEITIFNIGAIYSPGKKPDGAPDPDSHAPGLAGPVFERVDRFLGRLGRPVGLKTYKPYHSSGEDHLPSDLGMIGIPMDIVPEFPAGESTVLLTEQARFDPAIVDKIRRQLTAGRTVVITSGLLKALQGKGIEDVVELESTGRTVAIREFGGRGAFGTKLDADVLIPEIRYYTNDSWELVTAFTSPNRTSGTPVLHSAKYSKGTLYVLTIPQAQGDLYRYPQPVLRPIREVLARDQYVRLDAPSMVALFPYDNDTFMVESFAAEPVHARIVTARRITKLQDLETGEEIAGQAQGNNTVFDTPLKSGTFRVFAAR